MSRYIVIGDVHGCINELTELIESISLRQDDTIVFVGDLIDRGPAEVDTVKYAVSLKKYFDVIFIEGNHENKFRRFCKHKTESSKYMYQISDFEKSEELYASLSSEEREFLCSGLYYYRIPNTDYLVVHAGIPENIECFPDNYEDFISLPKKQRDKYDQLQRIRYIKSDGKLIRVGEQGESDVFWAEKYTGRLGHIIFGHNAFVDSDFPVEFPFATGIDLGAVYGNRLAALIIDNKGRDIFSVKSHGRYAENKEQKSL